MGESGQPGKKRRGGRGDGLQALILGVLVKLQCSGLSRKELTHIVAQQLGDTSKKKLSNISNAISDLIRDGAVRETIFLHPGSESLGLFHRAQVYVKPRRHAFDEHSRRHSALGEQDYLQFLRSVSSRIVAATQTDWPKILRSKATKGLPRAIVRSAASIEIAIVDVEMIHSSLGDFDIVVTLQFRTLELLMLYVRSVINSLPEVERTHTQYIQYSLVREERSMTHDTEESSPARAQDSKGVRGRQAGLFERQAGG
jgi:hypothetical protein